MKVLRQYTVVRKYPDKRLCTKSASPLNQNRKVATGPILNLRSLATILRLNLWPVATASGSDTGLGRSRTPKPRVNEELNARCVALLS